MNIIGFISGIGDVADAVNIGIYILRGRVLDAVFSAIAMLPTIGSVLATPIRTIFHAVGDSAAVTKAVTNLGILCGGSGKIVSKLDEISKGLKKLANNIPNVIATLKNNYSIKMRIGKKQFNNIVSDVRNGMNSLITYSNKVISTVKTAVKKSVKEEAKTQSYGSLKMNLQFFASKGVSKSISLPSYKNIIIDIGHIASGHTSKGVRAVQSTMKDLFPSNMTEKQIESAVRNAYKNGKKVQTQGDRVKIIGKNGSLTIEMWVNTVTKTIETAYPK